MSVSMTPILPAGWYTLELRSPKDILDDYYHPNGGPWLERLLICRVTTSSEAL